MYSSTHTDLRGFIPWVQSVMHKPIVNTVRWLRLVWTDAADASSQTWRRHVRGLIIGWALTAAAMSLVQMFPNDANLSMYGMLMTEGLPWQQTFLAAVEIAAPLLMGWHLLGLQRWGQRRLSDG
jgi:hypothetical protein